MKITIIFPARGLEVTRATISVMPPSLTLLAALTPAGHELTLVDMFGGDAVDYDASADLVAITVRTPLATVAYEIADTFLRRGTTVVLGGPHVFALPQEAKRHATAVAIGEGEKLWPAILKDAEEGALKDYYVCGPYAMSKLEGAVYHERERPSLDSLPMMRRDLLPRKRYLMDSIFTTRGCPNHCRFCPVTHLFGATIRHRPIDAVVAEVNTLPGPYFNIDDSVFGHPQITDRPQENQYYLDLYQELAGLRPKRWWTGAGGLSAINYKDGRKILERAAASGLSAVAAGLESISMEGQKQSGAWKKLHYTSAESFDLAQMKENVKAIQALGIAVLGFFVIGWDHDTPDTYRRTLDFCDECNIVPFIFTLMPTPGSQVYEEYLRQGRIDTSRPWDDYGIDVVVKHPTMSAQDMVRRNAEVMTDGYSMGRILKRTAKAFKDHPSLNLAKSLFFTQLGLRKAYRETYAPVLASARPS